MCTNKPETPARAMLREMGLESFFRVVVGGDTLPVRKPAPAPLWAAMAALAADRVLFIGDSETDWETAQAAQVPFALFTEGYRNTPPAGLPGRFVFSSYGGFARRALAEIQRL